MISKIASRVAREFLKLAYRIAVENPLHSGGTVQVKNLAAKYDVKRFDGRISDCQFRISFDIIGQQFILAGTVKSGHVSLTSAQGPGPNGLVDIPLASFPSLARKYFRVDPELWVKAALEDCLVRSVGQGDLEKWIVLDGEVLDSSHLEPEEAPAAAPSVPMPRAM